MESKLKKLTKHFNNGDIKESLKIIKMFYFGITKDEKSILTRAFEMFENRCFYEQLGYDFDEQLKLSNNIIKLFLEKNKYKQ